MPSPSNRLGGPLVLMILDGFGERPAADDNAITRARTPRYTALRETYPHTTIGTSGPDVGLPVGQMGNSEVGHLNFGAGRVAQMDISRIDCAVADGTLATNPQIHAAIEAAKRAGGSLHLLGLVSNGGVHSSLAHLLALIDQVAAAGVPLVVHAFLDGRDTPPKSAGGFLETVHARLTERRAGTIGTVTGRYWAMDRDKRWDRVEKAYRAIVFGEGRRGAGDDPGFHNAMAALADAYGLGQNDEFVEPRIVAGYDGARPGDAALFFNFRPDRARELSAALTQPAFADFDRTAGHPGAWRAPFTPFVGMTEYEASLGLPVAFTKPTYEGMFPAVISAAGFRQLRCAETEKYAHVTYFFNGGVESPLPGEQRVLVPSPKDVATYDLRPQMSAAGVADAVVAALSAGDLDFVLVNFANPDMVGHTGVLPAAIAAIEAVDGAIGRVVDATLAQHGALLITADHGNCEQMVDPTTGGPHTAHTLNRVPFHYVREGHEHAVLRTGGRIADVAPTMLRLLGLPTPKEMTGEPLIDEG